MTVMHSGLRLVTPPTGEPLTLEEVKNFLRVDSDLTADDTLIAGYIMAARLLVEYHTGTQLMPATYLYALDSFWGFEVPGGVILLGQRPIPQQRGGGGWGWPYRPVIRLTRWPVLGVDFIKYYDADGELQTLATSEYTVDTISLPTRLCPAWGKVWPVTREIPNAVQVQFQAGFPDADNVPATFKTAMLMLIGGWYQSREQIESVPGTRLPIQLRMLLGIEDTGWYG